MSLLSNVSTPVTASAVQNSSAAQALTSGNTSTSTSAAQADYNSQYTQFLTLLTTELQNQDPTSPLDTNQFTSQLVQFSTLEQQINGNSSLQQLVAGQQATQVGSALGYLGHTVQATGNSIALDGTNGATINYSLAAAAQTAVMTITNSAGTNVGQITVPATAGATSYSYDGTNGNGNALPAGNYTYSIVATDSTGKAVTATTYTTGTVTGVDTSGGTTTLELGTLSVPASTVTQVTS